MKAWATLLLAGGVALTLAGCPPDAPELFWDEQFESTCDGSPCGWLVGAGPVGSVLWVETLPGEHGIAMFGDRVAVLGPAEGIESDTTLDASNVIAYLAARCDEGADLTVEVTVQDLTTARIDSYRGTVLPGPRWDDGISSVVLRRVGGATITSFFRDIVAIRIIKGGPGVCEIDEIGLASSAGLRF